MNRKLGIVVSLAAILWMVGLVAWAWSQLPATGQVPLHWNAQGVANRYGTRAQALQGLALAPLVAAGVAALLFVIPSIEPRRRNLALSGRPYVIVWVAVMVFLAGVDTVIVLGTVERVSQTLAFARLIPIGVGVLFVVIGNYLGKVRSNFFFGIRTPWTLSSERSWNRTHRLGGWLMIVFGLVIAASAFDQALLLWLVLGGAVALVAILSAYSYVQWRNDPDKQAFGR
jgi:uncharacterized membrane protein